MPQTLSLRVLQHDLQQHDRIRPLPDDLVAKLKSSSAIGNLEQVICGLLENSLDAKATRIVIQVQDSRGACIVDDNGKGIPPLEFTENGGLGKRHHTSKHNDFVAQHGSHGAFLASLSTLSLLTITSKHEDFRSTNRITIHMNATLARNTPFPEQIGSIGKAYSTRVSVCDLFGNMPVRVKHRQMRRENPDSRNQLWESLKLRIIAYLLAWPEAVNVKLIDIDAERSIILSTTGPQTPGRLRTKDDSIETETLCFNSQALLNELMLGQNWIAAAASCSTLTIRGIIGLRPVATRAYQFLSLGMRPLLSGTNYDELYDHINDIFKQSDFGALDSYDDEFDRRKQNDVKNGRIRGKDLKTSRKGVDRWPIFVLQIKMEDNGWSQATEFLRNGRILDLTLTTLTSLVSKWLAAQQIRCAGNVRTSTVPKLTSPESMRVGKSMIPTSRRSSLRPDCFLFTTIENDRDSIIARSETVRRDFERSIARPKSATSLVIARGPDYASNESVSKQSSRAIRTTAFYGPPADPAANTYDKTQLSNNSPSISNAAVDANISADEQHMVWTDPVSRQQHLVSARTGMPIRNIISALNHPSSRRLTMRPHSAPNSQASPLWIDDIQRSWINPVFQPAEKVVSDIRPLFNDNEGRSSALHVSCNHGQHITPAFSSFSHVLRDEKVSKEAFKRFRLISQVDHQFILLVLPTVRANEMQYDQLVILDQHAADERVKVEQFYAELCLRSDTASPAQGLYATFEVNYSTLVPPLIFEIAPEEVERLHDYMFAFKQWGINYVLDRPPINDADIACQVRVNTVPSVIMDRCKSEPRLLLSALRQHIWQPKQRIGGEARRERNADEPSSPTWLRMIGDCPQGILDMVHSRACRSAIMFNDVLTPKEGQDLVSNLARCVFPFQCAHGRPSMVPLLRIDSQAIQPVEVGDNCGKKTSDSFVSAIKKWHD